MKWIVESTGVRTSIPALVVCNALTQGWLKRTLLVTLVRDFDQNGAIDNGAELFGDQALLSNGQRAAKGYAALADLDGNHDREWKLAA